MSVRSILAVALVSIGLVLATTTGSRTVAVIAAAGIAGGAFAIMLAMRPRESVTVLFVAGAFLLDFSPLAVYRYFLLSDLLLLLACLIQWRIDRSCLLYVPTLWIGLCAAYLGALLVSFGAARDFSGLWTWAHSAFLMLVFVPSLTTLFVRRPELKNWLLAAIVATALAQSVILFGEIARGLEWRSGTRIPGALGTAGLWNYAAAVTALTGVVAVGRWPSRMAALAGLAVIAVAEMFLRSRMLWLTSMLGACLMLSLYQRRLLRGVVVAAAIAAAISVGYLADWYPEAVQRRIMDALNPTEASDLIARLQVIRELTSAIEESGGLGIGVMQSARYLREHHSTAPVVTIHNVVLHAAVEGGVIAGVAILLLPLAIIALWRAAARLAARGWPAFLVSWETAVLLAACAGAQLAPSLYEHTFYAIFAALAASAVHVEARGECRPFDDAPGAIAGREIPAATP
jgi:O-antigen ligase